MHLLSTYYLPFSEEISVETVAVFPGVVSPRHFHIMMDNYCSFQKLWFVQNAEVLYNVNLLEVIICSSPSIRISLIELKMFQKKKHRHIVKNNTCKPWLVM